MKFVKAVSKYDENHCYIPVKTIDRISVLGSIDGDEFMVYCVRADVEGTYEYYDLAGPFASAELALAMMDNLVAEMDE